MNTYGTRTAENKKARRACEGEGVLIARKSIRYHILRHIRAGDVYNMYVLLLN